MGQVSQYLTSDDKFGSLLGSSTLQTISVPDDGGAVKLADFSVNVPQHFAWVISNPSFSSIIASVVTGSDYNNIQGGISTPATEYWSSSAPIQGSSFSVLGDTSSYYNENWGVRLEGTVPEPATMGLLALGGMAVLLKRHRKTE